GRKTTVPKTTVPKTTGRKTTVPKTTVPKTTVPKTTVPKTTVQQKIPPPPTDLAPMLATAGTVQNVSDEQAWRFEGKWDGIRALATLGPAGLRLHSRAGNDFTHAYPELQELTEVWAGHSGVLDGEIVALDGDGRTSFSLLQQRMNLAAARDV